MDGMFLTLSSASIGSQQLFQTPRAQELGLGTGRTLPGTYLLKYCTPEKIKKYCNIRAFYCLQEETLPLLFCFFSGPARKCK